MKKLIIGAMVTLIHACAYADSYVFTPQGMTVIMPAGTNNWLINNPNGGAAICSKSGNDYICTGDE